MTDKPTAGERASTLWATTDAKNGDLMIDRITRAIEEAVEAVKEQDILLGSQVMVKVKAEEKEASAKALDDLYERGLRSLSNTEWRQAWGSGVLDAAMIVRGRK